MRFGRIKPEKSSLPATAQTGEKADREDPAAGDKTSEFQLSQNLGERVRQVLQRVCLEKGFPEMLRSDNGSEFIGQAVNKWLTANEIKPLFIEPGKPWQNGKGERALMENSEMNS